MAGVIDLTRGSRERERVSGSGSSGGVNSLIRVIELADKNNKIKAERENLDNIVNRIAISERVIQEPELNQPGSQAIGPPQVQQPSDLERLRSITGGSSGGGVGQKVDSAILSDRLKKALNPNPLTPEEQRQAALNRAGITARASSTSQTRPTQQTPAQKDFDRAVKVLTDTDKAGSFVANQTQRENARNNLRNNPDIIDVPVDGANFDSFMEATKEGKKVDVKGATFDEAFGEEAYGEALEKIKDEALADGVTEESAERAFNNWWDKMATQKDHKGEFGKLVVPRDQFKGAANKAEQRKPNETIQQFLERTGI